jgi:hypothetical protein
LALTARTSFDEHKFDAMLATPTEQRPYYIAEAFRRGRTVEDVHSSRTSTRGSWRRSSASIAVERRDRASRQDWQGG